MKYKISFMRCWLYIIPKVIYVVAVYKSVLMLWLCVSRSTIYLILARHKGLPEDDVLTSKHVAANHMQLYVIKVLILCSCWSNYI